MILDEKHKSMLSIHLGATKICKDLKLNFLSRGMKKQVARVCCIMSNIPESKSATWKAKWYTSIIKYSRAKIGEHLNGFSYGIAKNQT